MGRQAQTRLRATAGQNLLLCTHLVGSTAVPHHQPQFMLTGNFSPLRSVYPVHYS